MRWPRATLWWCSGRPGNTSTPKSASRGAVRSGDWGRSGWDPEKNYADFDSYSIRLKSPSLAVDSARFTTELFPDPLLGQLTDKASARRRDDKDGRGHGRRRGIRGSTPTSIVSMPDIVPGVDFQGGLTVRGAELQGKGNEDVPATLDFRKGDTVLVQCRANLFILRAQQFSGQGGGSRGSPRCGQPVSPRAEPPFQPRLAQTSSCARTKAWGRGPFSDSYHKVSLDCDVLSWRLDETVAAGGPSGCQPIHGHLVQRRLLRTGDVPANAGHRSGAPAGSGLESRQGHGRQHLHEPRAGAGSIWLTEPKPGR